MAKKKTTAPGMKKMKIDGKKLRMVTAYDYPTAVLVDKTEIELILVGDSLGMTVLGYEGTVKVTMEDMLHHIKPVVKGAPNTFIVGDMPFGAYNVSPEQAISNANRLMKEGGCDCIKLEGGMNMADKIKAIVDAGIPVMAHIGLTPQTSSQLGGFKVQGKSAEAAKTLLAEAKAVEDAGAFAVVVECVPAPLGKFITEKIEIPTIGIGAGPDCDGQVLVTQDMIGMFDQFTPKFVKKYANVGDIIVEVFEKFADEVQTKEFPAKEHCFTMKEDALEELKKLM
ncbi:MAG: 3-methyl-2-oxobutanoate hydroxymethyltransferase [Clostridiales bacterium]|nr:3-methyl-2-oxobutanoate hydroxymethyltransferase [Clostridiales bacterium]